MLEHALYPPVKAFLETQGYVVKGEVNGCDLVAIRGEEPPVIVELKNDLLPAADLSRNRAAGPLRQCLSGGSAVFRSHYPPD